MFFEILIGMISRSTTETILARKGGHRRPRVDDECLALGRSPDPEIHVVSSVALVQSIRFRGKRISIKTTLTLNVVRNERHGYHP